MRLSTLIALFAALVLAGSSRAQEQAREQDPELVRLELRVTAVSDSTVWLDAGSLAGLDVGDELLLYPIGRQAVPGVIRAISKQSARAEVVGTLDGIEAGVRGEVLVPAGRTQGDPELPWTHPVESWDADQPLLAPALGVGPAERELRLHGRAWTRYYTTTDDESDGREYTSSRTGVDFLWENPFERGGQLHLDAEVSYRTTELEDEDDESETTFRPERFSYAWGGVRGQPRRWQVGRFLHHEFPELGVVDGVEYTERVGNGRFGASVGLLPEPNDDMDTGDDVGTSLYYRWISNEDEDLALGAAFQKTWHEGDSDRDLFVLTGDWRAGTRTFVHGTAWVDVYGSGDDAKSDGPEITQLYVSANHRFESGDGVGLFASIFRFPELLKNEFTEVTEAELADGKTTRIGVNGWKKVSDSVRLSARVDSWDDEDESGGSAEAAVALRDLLWDRGELSLALVDTEGRYSSGLGLRLRASRYFDAGYLSLAYETTDFEQDDFTGSLEELTQEVFRVSWDGRVGGDWSYSVYAEERFGDEQDSTSVGFRLQRRF